MTVIVAQFEDGEVETHEFSARIPIEDIRVIADGLIALGALVAIHR